MLPLVLVWLAEVELVAHLIEEDGGAVFSAEERLGGHDGACLGRETYLVKKLVFVSDDAVDDDNLLGHLTHVGNTWILLRFFDDGLLDDTLLFLLRTQRERQQQC